MAGAFLLYLILVKLNRKNWIIQKRWAIISLAAIIAIHLCLIVAAKNGRKIIENPDPQLRWLQANQSENYLKKVIAESQYYGQLSTYYFKLGRFEEAEKSLREACRLNPADGIARYNLALLLIQRGDIEAALEQLQIALEINPDDADAGTLYEKIGNR